MPNEPIEPDGPVEPAPRWGIPDAVLAFVGGYLLSVVAAGAFVAATSADPTDRTFGPTVAALVGLWSALVGGAVYAARSKGSGSPAHDFGLRLEAGDIGRGLVGGIASQVAIVLVYRLLGVDDLGRDNRELLDSTHGAGLVVLCLLLAIGAPIVEELFFRGFLQRAVVRRAGPALGIGVTGAAFGLTHFDLVALPGLATFGVVLGILAHRYGRLGPSIVAHVFFNAMALSLYLAT